MTPGFEKGGAAAFDQFALEYDQVQGTVGKSSRPEALWQALEEVLVPLWTQRLTEIKSQNNPIGYIFGEQRPCPLRGEIGNDQSIAANTWCIPDRHGKGWDTPVARVIRRAFDLTGATVKEFAVFAEERPTETASSNPYGAWKRQLARWKRPWCADDAVEKRPSIPRPESIRQFVILLDRMVDLDVASKDGVQPANAFAHYLQLDESQQADYVLRYYAESEPRHLAHVREHKLRIADQVRGFAKKKGALTSDRLLKALMIARAVQSACFGLDSYTRGLRHLAAARWGEAEADDRMAGLINACEDGIRQRAEYGLRYRPQLGELLDRVESQAL